MKITINITKEVLEATKMCGRDNKSVVQNCAIAYAVRKLFPNVEVNHLNIWNLSPYWAISLPKSAKKFIHEFDK